MSATLINLGPTGSATTVWSAKVDDAQTLLVTVNAIAGSTITVESSADNSSYSAIPVGLNVTSGAPGVAITSGQITAVGRYVFHINNTYVRIRISTYVGPGNVDVTPDLSADTLRRITRQLDTALTAIGNSQATALPLQAQSNRFGTVAASTGCILPDNNGVVGYEVLVRNAGANSLSVYPPVGKAINGGSVNAALAVAATAATRLIADASGNYWSF